MPNESVLELQHMNIEQIEHAKDFHIEEPALADVDDIVEVRKQSWMATYPNADADITAEDIESIEFKSEKMKEQIEMQLEGISTNHLWVAKRRNHVVGFCVAGLGRNEEGNELHAIYVLPEVQGMGVGKALMNTALDWLDSGKDTYLWVTSYNQKAIEFYERFGFHKTHETKLHELKTKPVPKKMEIVKMMKRSL